MNADKIKNNCLFPPTGVIGVHRRSSAVQKGFALVLQTL